MNNKNVVNTFYGDEAVSDAKSLLWEHYSSKLDRSISRRSKEKKMKMTFWKANWSGYATDVDVLIEEVDPTTETYEWFVEAIRVASRKHIPREGRSHYIPGLSEESKAYKMQAILLVSPSALLVVQLHIDL